MTHLKRMRVCRLTTCPICIAIFSWFEGKKIWKNQIQSVECIWQPMNFYDAESCLLFIYCFINELESTETIAISPIMINPEARKAKLKNMYSIYWSCHSLCLQKIHGSIRFVSHAFQRHKCDLFIYYNPNCLHQWLHLDYWFLHFKILFPFFWSFVVALQLIESQW